MTWFVEEGIGEERAIRVKDGAIVAAKLAWPGEMAAGAVVDAKLVSRPAGSPRGTARLDDGTLVLVDRLPRAASEGASIRIEITRASIGEAGRVKLAQGRPSEHAPCTAPTLARRLAQSGESVRTVHRFAVSGWNELCAEARECRVDFAGGAIVLSPTPAMTLIDVDGDLPPPALALAAADAIGAALHRFEIGGSVGIDFPTLSDKADRRAVGDRLGNALDQLAHERTAMNGFGFVQIVSRLSGPSILHRIARDPLGAAARRVLRMAESVEGPGALLITCHPALEAALRPEWRDALIRRSGRQLRIAADPALAPTAGFAQSVPL